MVCTCQRGLGTCLGEGRVGPSTPVLGVIIPRGPMSDSWLTGRKGGKMEGQKEGGREREGRRKRGKRQAVISVGQTT